MITTAVGKDIHVSMSQSDPDVESAAARRLAEALAPSAIDALLADAQAVGTPIDGVDGLLNGPPASLSPRTTGQRYA